MVHLPALETITSSTVVLSAKVVILALRRAQPLPSGCTGVAGNVCIAMFHYSKAKCKRSEALGIPVFTCTAHIVHRNGAAILTEGVVETDVSRRAVRCEIEVQNTVEAAAQSPSRILQHW